MTSWDLVLITVCITYVPFKALTLRNLSPGPALAYVALWPGMEPEPFGARTDSREGLGLMAWGMVKMAGGAILLSIRTGYIWVDAAIVLLGIGTLVHLGFIDALTGFWRLRGIRVERLFVNPAGATSLRDFWGRRWNRAFHVIARDRIFKPVARRWGTTSGIVATFVFSGVLHDLLISLPAGGGYGLPTLYFLLQGVGMLVEGRVLGTSPRHTLPGRFWSFAWVVFPAPLLFHPWFIECLIFPMI